MSLSNVDFEMLQRALSELERDPSLKDETLRDRFAMAALTGLCGNGDLSDALIKEDMNAEHYPANMAKACFEMADAMMVAR